MSTTTGTVTNTGLLYDRDISLQIGPESLAGFEITGLRMQFSVKKTMATNTVNTCDLTINNLSRDTLSKLRATNHNTMVILKAGYKNNGGASTIFIGNMVNSWTDYKKPNIETHFTLHDGEYTLRTSKVNLSASAGSSAKNLLKNAVAQIGLPQQIAGAIDQFSDKILNKGMTFLGTANNALNEIAQYMELQWSIQDGKLVLVRAGAPSQDSGVLLTPETGLIGSPERISSIVPATAAEQKAVDGWRFTSLLIPAIMPLSLVSVQSNDIPHGTFKVISVEHKGDTHSSDWSTVTEAVQV
jgi:hypothetical protein